MNAFINWIKDSYDRDTMVDIARYGSNNGYSGITYTGEINALYARYESDIFDILTELADNNDLPMWQLFKWDSLVEFKQNSVWIAVEYICDCLTRDDIAA